MKAIIRLVTYISLAWLVRNRWLLWSRLSPSFRTPNLLLNYSLSGPLTLWASRNVGRKIPDDSFKQNLDFAEIELADCKLLTYAVNPRTSPSPVLIWIHGGGFVAGSAAADHLVAARYAEVINGAVVNVDYRLAPEHPFPAALDDCFAALNWVIENATEQNFDTSRIAVGGMSAGGGLAAALAQKAKDAGIELSFQFLIYPMLNPISAVIADTDNRGLTWSRSSNEYAWGSYLGHHPGIPELRPYAAAANRKDLTGLAPAWIGVGDKDLFYAENLDYAKRLTESGVECELLVSPGMYHAADRIQLEHHEIIEFVAASEKALKQGLKN